MNINPPTSYQAEDRGPEILGIVIFFFVLALIAVLLRFVSRRVSAVNFWWDDWILLLATVKSHFIFWKLLFGPSADDWF